MSEAIPRGYRIIAANLREQDVAEAERIAEALRSGGWRRSNRSFVIRAALVCLSDALRGKSAPEMLRYFSERRARHTPRIVGPPGARVGPSAVPGRE